MAESSSAVTAYRSHAVHPKWMDTDEADRSTASQWPRENPADALIGPGAPSSNPTERICSRAMAIIDKQGAKALTLRDLAADLRISTRTLHKHIGSREKLLRRIAGNFADGLDLSVRVKESWRATSLEWCVQLRNALIASPHLSLLLDDTITQSWARNIESLADLAVHEGIPRALGQECLRSLVHATVDDAFTQIRGALHDGTATDPQRIHEKDFIDTLGLVVDRMQERSRFTAPIEGPKPKPRRVTPTASDRRRLAKMDRAGQASFAWALEDAAKPYLNDASRVWLVTKIGAGDLEDAIFDLLRCVEGNRAVLPTSTSVQVQRWLNGYLGSDREAFLRSLINGLRFE